MIFRRPYIVTAVAPAALLVLVACGGEQRRGGPQNIPVTVAKAELRAVPYEISAPGTVEAINAVQVASQVPGIVTSVRFREGDEVKQGQVLFTIDSRPYRNALTQAEAALSRDLIQLNNAQRQVDRYQALAKNEYVTDEQYQSLRTTADAFSATVKSDSAAVDNARANLEFTTIRAPLTGRTGSLQIRAGNLVRTAGTTVVMVNQTKPIQVRFAVPATYLPEIRARNNDSLLVRVKPGGTIATAADQPTLEGVLAFVDNAVDTTTGTILLKGRFDNAQGILWPGQFVSATVVLYVEQAIVVPQPAVMIGDRGNYVFLVDAERKANTRPVATGRLVGDVLIVNSGLTADDLVVSDGQLRLIPGARVDIKNAAEVGLKPDSSARGPGGAGGAGGAGGGRGRGNGGQPGAGDNTKRGGGGNGGGQQPNGSAPARESTQ